MKKHYCEVHFGFFLLMLFVIFLFTPIKSAYALDNLDMTTHHNDNQKTGANLRETILNTSNVNKDTFGKLFSLPVDGQIYTQPLYLSNFDIGGKVRNVVFIGTMHNTVYCFDADDGSTIWTNHLDPSVPLPNKDVGPPYYFDIKIEVGILSTPVIARDTNTIYLVDMTYSTDPNTGINSYSHKLYALDLTNGAVKGSPKKIEATVPGTAAEGNGSTVSWNSQFQSQRLALTLANGRIYFGSASFADKEPYHGWILGYNATTLEQEVAFNTTPNGDKGGVWQSGQGVTVDSEGNIYFVSGNGSNDVNTKIGGDTVFKLSNGIGSPTKLLDWFIPWNFPLLDSQDTDLGSTGVLLIPGTDRLLLGSKEGKIYILDRQKLGHLHDAFLDGTDAQIVQSLKVSEENVHGTPVYWEGPSGKLIYVWAEADTFKAFKFDGNKIDPTPFSEGKIKIESMIMPGGFLSISANGSEQGSGIIWVNMPLSKDANRNTVEGILRAYNATDLTKELWNSKQNDPRDHLGNFGKFVPPTVMNGKVYMSTFGDNVAKGTLNVYGLIKDATLTDLHFSEGNLSPVFSKGTQNYDLSVTDDVYSILAAPLATDSQSLIKINGSVVQSGQSSSAIGLPPGSSTIMTNVYAADGLTTNTYTVNVVRNKSNALLSGISLSGISLDNTVTSRVYDYNASVSLSINSVIVTATPQNSQAAIVLKNNGNVLNSNLVTLGTSNNVISIDVTSADGLTKNTYKVNINRTSNNASLSDINLSNSNITLDKNFSKTVYTYYASVPYGTNATLVTAPTSDSNASMVLKKNGELTGGRIGLSIGLNVITLEVTAEDGITTQLYEVNIYRSPIIFIANIKVPTNQNITVNIYYPADAAVKQVSTDNTTWTTYTAPIITADNETIYAKYQNLAGNWSEISSFAVMNIDKISPENATFAADITDPTNQNVIVSVNFPADAAIKQISTDNTTWTAYTAPIVAKTNVTIYAKSQDLAGNWSDVSSFTVMNIDNISPENATFAADITDPTNQNVTVSVNFPADAAIKQVSTDNITWTAYKAPIAATTNVTIYAKSQDLAGNWSDVSNYAVTNIDKMPPETPVLSADVSTATNGSVAVTITYSADSTVKEYRINGGTWTTYLEAIVATENETIDAMATDAVGNASTGTLTVSNIDKIVPPSRTYEAEYAVLSDGARVAKDHTGYTGNGFVDGYWFLGAATQFTVNTASAGNYYVTLRYANAQGSTATLSVYINGTKTTQTFLPNLATWETWGTKSEVFNLNAGSNTIMFKYDTTDSGNVNLDNINVDLTPTPEPGNNALLSRLSLSGITLDKTVSSTVYTYSASVSNSVVSTTVTATTADNNATSALKKNGTLIIGNSITLDVGSNVITVEVTAEDGKTKQPYTVTVTRDNGTGTVPGTGDGVILNPPSQTAAIPAPKQKLESDATEPIVIPDDGQLISKGTSSDGQAETIVTMDADKFINNFKADGQKQLEMIDIKGNNPIVIVNIPTNALIDQINKSLGSVVGIKYDGTTYLLPLSIFKDLPKDTILSVILTKVSDKTGDEIKIAIKKQGADPLLSTPIDFKINIDGKELTDVHGINADRIFNIGTTVDPSKTTAVWIDANNNIHFIPSNIVSANGGSIVTIHSPHNSIYTVIQSDKTFADIQEHWAKSDIELLANKLIVSGDSDKMFAPDRQITRAEFVAMLSRGLGLVEVNSNANFSDVKTTDWFDGAVGAALKAKLISGYEDNTFRPNDIITRQQMVLIISKALKIGGKEVSADIAKLNQFTDQDTIAEWAKDASSQLLSLKIVLGTTSTTFGATENVTRAQAVAMTKRMLQALQFIN